MPGQPFDASSAAHVVDILKAVAHPVRLRIVALLCEDDAHVTAMAEHLDIPQAAVSQQLRILRMNGLVDVSRKGGFAVYRLTEPNLTQLVDTMRRCCAERRRAAADGGAQ